jgi:hypothetical protein
LDLYGLFLKVILPFVRLKQILEVVSCVVAIAAGLGWFVSSIFPRDQRLKKWLKWLLGGTCLVATITAILCSSEQTPSASRATATSTTGPNSPAASVSNVGSGATVTVTQVSGNQTVNNGISEATMLELLRDKSIASNRELSEKYPYGYVLVGVVNGKLIYQSFFNQVEILTDWNENTLQIDTTTHLVILYFHYLKIGGPGGGGQVLSDVRLVFSYAENGVGGVYPFAFQLPSGHIVRIAAETLDAAKGVFVAGFK